MLVLIPRHPTRLWHAPLLRVTVTFIIIDHYDDNNNSGHFYSAVSHLQWWVHHVSQDNKHVDIKTLKTIIL